MTRTVILPSSPGVVDFQPRLSVAQARHASQFSGRQRTYDFMGRRWEFTVSYPPMLARSDRAELWVSRLLELEGGTNNFLYGDPFAKLPRGEATGTPRVKGVNQTGLIARTNHLKWSEQLDVFDEGWGWVNLASADDAQDYDPLHGELVAAKIVENTANSSHQVFQDFGKDSATTLFTASGYFKRNGRNVQGRVGNDGSNYVRINFNLAAGTMNQVVPVLVGSGVTGVHARMEDAGAGWYRCSLVARLGAQQSGRVLWSLADDSFATSYTGDGASGVFAYGMQVEAGAGPTPYVKTTDAVASRYYAGLETDGWTASRLDQLKVGDYVQVERCLYRTAVVPVDSDDLGNATIFLEPKPRKVHADDEPIVTRNARGLFLLAPEMRGFGWTADALRRYGLTFSAMEDVQ